MLGWIAVAATPNAAVAAWRRATRPAARPSGRERAFSARADSAHGRRESVACFHARRATASIAENQAAQRKSAGGIRSACKPVATAFRPCRLRPKIHSPPLHPGCRIGITHGGRAIAISATLSPGVGRRARDGPGIGRGRFRPIGGRPLRRQAAANSGPRQSTADRTARGRQPGTGPVYAPIRSPCPPAPPSSRRPIAAA